MGKCYCLICFKDYRKVPVRDTGKIEKRKDLLKRFYRLLSRHLNERNEGGGGKDARENDFIGREELIIVEQLIDCGMETCEDCFNSMKSFCELFHLIKSMELLLKWKVWNFKNIMESAQKNSSRICQDVRRRLSNLGTAEEDENTLEKMTDTFVSFNKKLLRNGSSKFLNDYPKLCLKKCGETETTLPKDHEAVGDANLPSSSQTKSILQTLNPVVLLTSCSDTNNRKRNSEIIQPRHALLDEVATEYSKLSAPHPTKKELQLPLLLVSFSEGEEVCPSDNVEDDFDFEDRISTISPTTSKAEVALFVNNEGVLGSSPTTQLQGPSQQMNITESNSDREQEEFVSDLDYGIESDPARKGPVKVEVATMSDLNGKSKSSKLKRGRGKGRMHRDRKKKTTASVSEPFLQETDNEESQDGAVDEIQYERKPATLLLDQLEIVPAETTAQPSTSISGLQREMTDEASVSSEPKIRNLRRVYRCNDCGKTFSAEDRLQFHKTTECSGQLNIPEERDHDRGNLDSDQLNGFEDNSNSTDTSDLEDSTTGTSDEDEEENVEMETWTEQMKVEKTKGESKQVEIVGKKVSASTFRYNRQSKGGNVYYRYKCPHCPFLCQKMDQVLYHRSVSHVTTTCSTDKQGNDKTIIVEILRFLSNPVHNYLDDLEGFEFETIAKVKVAPDVFYCDIGKCAEPFYTEEALQMHRQLHGSFLCQFCPVVKNYLPQLTKHEMEHSPTKEKFRSSHSTTCARCKAIFDTRLEYIRHHISAHFSLQYVKHGCAVCRAPFGHYERANSDILRVNQRFEHYAGSHDVGELPSSSLHNCNVNQCPAYFLTAPQLYSHVKTEHIGTPIEIEPPQHNNKPRYEKRSNLKSWYWYCCPQCNQIFRHMHGVMVHLVEFHNLTSASEESSKVLIKLISSERKDRSKKVENCCISAIQNYKELAELEISLPSSLFRCPIKNCKEVPFFSQEDLDFHAGIHGKFNCSKCKVVERYAPDLSEHELTHADKYGVYMKHFKCIRCSLIICGRRAFVSHHLREHLSIRFSDVRLGCKICNYSFAYRKNYCQSHVVEHYLTHHNLALKDNIFRCPESGCSAYFLKEQFLLQHRNKLHNVDGSNLDLETTLKEKKMKQMKAYTATQREKLKCDQVCETCGKLFKSKEQLNTHTLSHLGPEKWKFMCSICSKKCLTGGKLREHMRTHTQEKPFVCQVCGVKYAHRHNLRIHVNNKHGDVMQDIAKKVHKPNMTSRKGVKRKQSISTTYEYESVFSR